MSCMSRSRFLWWNVYSEHNGVCSGSIGNEFTRKCIQTSYFREKGIYPKDIMTREAFEKVITVVMALGCSTNAILQLLSMAHTIGVDLSIDDFNDIQKRVPHIADLKPSGKYVMEDLYNVGGVEA